MKKEFLSRDGAKDTKGKPHWGDTDFGFFVGVGLFFFGLGSGIGVLIYLVNLK